MSSVKNHQPIWKKVATALCCLILPPFCKPFFLRILGHQIGEGCRIGFSFIFVDSLNFSNGCRIGHLNFIHCQNVVLAERGYILHMNEVRGPLSLCFSTTASLGNKNKVRRAKLGISSGESVLSLGVLSKITANHIIDCMCSVEFGDYSTLAGSGSQIWTHGYVHDKSGPGRFRVDGNVCIGNNVYIGSASIVSMGVFVADSVVIGSASSVSKSIYDPGLYVSQPLRAIAYEPKEVASRLTKLDSEGLVEDVYVKQVSKTK